MIWYAIPIGMVAVVSAVVWFAARDIIGRLTESFPGVRRARSAEDVADTVERYLRTIAPAVAVEVAVEQRLAAIDALRHVIVEGVPFTVQVAEFAVRLEFNDGTCVLADTSRPTVELDGLRDGEIGWVEGLLLSPSGRIIMVLNTEATVHEPDAAVAVLTEHLRVL